jgi:6-phosphogluconolactonase
MELAIMTQTRVFISGCNNPTGYFASSNSPGISLFSIDFETSDAELETQYEDIQNPTFMTVHPQIGRIYATSEMPQLAEGSVTAFDVSDDCKQLDRLSTQSSAGSITAQISLDKSLSYLLVVNHGWDEDLGGRDQAMATIALDAQTGLGEISATVKHDGTGPQLPRQQRSHPHAVLATPDNRFLIVTDLGADALMVYRFDAANGSVQHVQTAALKPGCGPRHFAFSHDGERVHVCGELDSTVTTLVLDKDSGHLSVIGTCTTRAEGAKTTNYPSEIALSPSGKHLYVANRGDDTLARINVDTVDGAPIFVETVDAQGQTPRHFAVDPSSQYLLVANQDSDRVNSFKIGADDQLIPMDFSINIGTPTCIAFYR